MRAVDERLVDTIYEAAVLTDGWPDVLHRVAERVGAKGGVLFTASPGLLDWIASEPIVPIVQAYIAEGWAADPKHGAPLREDNHPGFRCETDYRSEEELAQLPVHAEFLDPRGFIAGVCTVLQGAGDDALQLAFEGFPSHAAAAAAVPLLDQLRPHFGRALSLRSAIRRSRSADAVEALALAGVAAAIIDGAGRLRSINAPFVTRMGDRFTDSPQRVRFADAFLNQQLSAALSSVRGGDAGIRSVPLPAMSSGEPSFAVQIVPLVGRARALCDSDGVLLLITEAANASLPDAGLLRLLYDLTPAEAQMARRIVEGLTITQAANAGAIGVETARTHLRQVFAKTGVRRQAELVRLLLAAR